MNIHSSARFTPVGRALLVRRVTQEGWPVGEAADAAGVSPRTAYKWLSRFEVERGRGACSTGPPDLARRRRRSPPSGRSWWWSFAGSG